MNEMELERHFLRPFAEPFRDGEGMKADSALLIFFDKSKLYCGGNAFHETA